MKNFISPKELEHVLDWHMFSEDDFQKMKQIAREHLLDNSETRHTFGKVIAGNVDIMICTGKSPMDPEVYANCSYKDGQENDINVFHGIGTFDDVSYRWKSMDDFKSEFIYGLCFSLNHDDYQHNADTAAAMMEPRKSNVFRFGAKEVAESVEKIVKALSGLSAKEVKATVAEGTKLALDGLPKGKDSKEASQLLAMVGKALESSQKKQLSQSTR